MFKKRRKLKTIISVVLVLALSAGIVGGIVALTRNDTKTISSTAFTRGDLNKETGEYVESNQAIYTKEAFYCQGLRIVPDFESKVTYDVYCYDYNDKLIVKELGLKDVYDEDHPLVKTARIVIHPEIPDNVKASDFKINFWEIAGYADDLKITVNKEQHIYETNNLLDSDDVTIVENASFAGAVGENIVVNNDKINLQIMTLKVDDSFKYYDCYLLISEDYSRLSSFYGAVTTEKNAGKVLVQSEPFWPSYELGEFKVGAWVKTTIELPSNFEEGYISIKAPMGSEYHLYGYN